MGLFTIRINEALALEAWNYVAPSGTITPGGTIGTPGILLLQTIGMAQSIRSLATVTGSLPVEAALIKNADGTAISSPTYADCTYDSASGKWICDTTAPAGSYPAGAQLMRLKGSSPPITAGSGAVVVTGSGVVQNIILAGVGDSITEGPTKGNGDDPANAPIMFADSRIASPGATPKKFGYPGQNMRFFLDNHKAEVAAVFQAGSRGILYFAFGANDINSRFRAQRYADFIEARDWALALPNVEKVIFIPVLNRTDPTYGFYLKDDGTKGDFNTERLVHNNWLTNTLTSGNSRLIAADFSQDSDLGSAAYPSNTLLCTDDLVHPTIVGSRHLGERVIAPAVALAGGVTLGPVTSDGNGSVSQTLTTTTYKPQPPNPGNATVNGSGQLVHQTNDSYDCNTPLSELVAQPKQGETVVVKVVGTTIPAGGAILLCTSFTYAQQGLAGTQLCSYCDEGNMGAYNSQFGPNGGFPNGTQPRNGQGNELSLRYTTNSVSAFAGNINLGSITIANDRWPQIPSAQLNGVGAAMAAPTILANTHLPSSY